MPFAKFVPCDAMPSRLGVRFSGFKPFAPRQSQRNWSEMIRIMLKRLRASGKELNRGAAAMADERRRKSRLVNPLLSFCRRPTLIDAAHLLYVRSYLKRPKHRRKAPAERA